MRRDLRRTRRSWRRRLGACVGRGSGGRGGSGRSRVSIAASLGPLGRLQPLAGADWEFAVARLAMDRSTHPYSMVRVLMTSQFTPSTWTAMSLAALTADKWSLTPPHASILPLFLRRSLSKLMSQPLLQSLSLKVHPEVLALRVGGIVHDLVVSVRLSSLPARRQGSSHRDARLARQMTPSILVLFALHVHTRLITRSSTAAEPSIHRRHRIRRGGRHPPGS